MFTSTLMCLEIPLSSTRRWKMDSNDLFSLKHFATAGFLCELIFLTPPSGMGPTICWWSRFHTISIWCTTRRTRTWWSTFRKGRQLHTHTQYINTHIDLLNTSHTEKCIHVNTLIHKRLQVWSAKLCRSRTGRLWSEIAQNTLAAAFGPNYSNDGTKGLGNTCSYPQQKNKN